VRIYVNGALRTTRTLGAPLNTAATAGNVGHSPLVARWVSSYFPGRIDEVAVYGTALPAERVAAHYAAGTNPGAPADGAASRGDGLRHSTAAAGVTTTYTWDVAAGLPMVLQDGTYSYVYGLGGALVSQTDAAGAQRYYLADGLGSTAALTDGSGAVTATFAYDVFGAVRASTGTATTGFGFTGQQADAGTGLMYLRARYYDPSTGRFLTKDPLRGAATAPLTQQRYAYAGNSPTRFADPSGQCFDACVVETVVVVAVGGGLIAVGTAQWAAYVDAHPELVAAVGERIDRVADTLGRIRAQLADKVRIVIDGREFEYDPDQRTFRELNPPQLSAHTVQPSPPPPPEPPQGPNWGKGWREHLVYIASKFADILDNLRGPLPGG
jgi:RHS repeat-associated protein